MLRSTAEETKEQRATQEIQGRNEIWGNLLQRHYFLENPVHKKYICLFLVATCGCEGRVKNACVKVYKGNHVL